MILIAATFDSSRSANNNPDPVVITSSRMEAEELAKKVVFTGSVVLKKDGMTMSSDTMVVFYEPGSREIREIEAHGNVMVRKEESVALSNNAIYFGAEEKVVLTGNARIVENDNQIAGEKITLFIRDNHSVVEGGKVILYQDKNGKSSEIKKRN
jgi:lipopolysaccharide export system protein LptA